MGCGSSLTLLLFGYLSKSKYAYIDPMQQALDLRRHSKLQMIHILLTIQNKYWYVRYTEIEQIITVHSHNLGK